MVGGFDLVLDVGFGLDLLDLLSDGFGLESDFLEVDY